MYRWNQTAIHIMYCVRTGFFKSKEGEIVLNSVIEQCEPCIDQEVVYLGNPMKLKKKDMEKIRTKLTSITNDMERDLIAMDLIRDIFYAVSIEKKDILFSSRRGTLRSAISPVSKRKHLQKDQASLISEATLAGTQFTEGELSWN